MKVAADDLKIQKAFNEDSMRRKIGAQLDTLILAEKRTAVLCPFGCGAFGNPPEEVARIYREELLKKDRCGKFTRILFACRSPEDLNYAVFKEQLDGLSLASYESNLDAQKQAHQNKEEGLRHIHALMEQLPGLAAQIQNLSPDSVPLMNLKLFEKLITKVQQLRSLTQREADVMDAEGDVKMSVAQGLASYGMYAATAGSTGGAAAGAADVVPAAASDESVVSAAI